MSLLFKHGALSADHISYVQDYIKRYPYVVLVKDLLSYEWIESNLIKHDVIKEYDMGGYYSTKRNLYGTFDCAAGRFYFFKDKRDYEAVCTLTDIVIDVQPFETIIETN